MRTLAFVRGVSAAVAGVVWAWGLAAPSPPADAVAHEHAHHASVQFSVRSVKDGPWSNPHTWLPARVPAAGDRVLVARGTRVQYDVKRSDVLRLVQVVGTLVFARDRDTELNVGVLKVQNSDECSESGFACDFEGVTAAGEPRGPTRLSTGACPTISTIISAPGATPGSSAPRRPTCCATETPIGRSRRSPAMSRSWLR